MLRTSFLFVSLFTLLSSELAAHTQSSTVPSSPKRNAAHNLSVVTRVSNNRFGHATFCSNVANITYTQEADFEVDGCRKLIDGLSGPVGYYNN